MCIQWRPKDVDQQTYPAFARIYLYCGRQERQR